MADFAVNQRGLEQPEGTSREIASPLEERFKRGLQRGRAAGISVENLLGREEDGVQVSLSKRAELPASTAIKTQTAHADNQVPDGYTLFSGTRAGGEWNPGSPEILPGVLIDILI